jgi:hypothetical protein
MTLSPENFFSIYMVHPDSKARKVGYTLSGRFLLFGGRMHILEDHFGHLKDMLDWKPEDNQITPQLERRIDSYRRSSYFDLVSDAEIQQGLRPDLLPAADVGEPMASGDIEPMPLGQPPDRS